MQSQNKAEPLRAEKKENIKTDENSEASETGHLGRKSKNKKLPEQGDASFYCVRSKEMGIGVWW